MHLLLIDVQNDFCRPSGALYVPGAMEDSFRLSEWILANLSAEDSVTFTLDSHQAYAIFHPSWWKDVDTGEAPAPFTNLEPGQTKYVSVDPENRGYGELYLKRMQENTGRPLTIWPEHCILGTTGHCIEPRVLQAVNARVRPQNIAYILKGQDPYNEMYSAFKSAADTSIWELGSRKDITPWYAALGLALEEDLVVAGQALSHCVRDSVEDLIEIRKVEKPKHPKIRLLTDLCSVIPGHEQSTQEWLDRNRKMLDTSPTRK